MTTITLPAGRYTVLAEGTITFLTREDDVVVEGELPSAFTAGQWVASYDAEAKLLTVVVNDNLLETPEVTNVQVQIGSEPWANTTEVSPGVYTVYVEPRTRTENVKIRKVNLLGVAADSDIKTAYFSDVIVTIDGLTNGFAEIGEEAGITSSPAGDSRAWGLTEGGTDFGTGTSPTSLAGNEGSLLHLVTTVGSEEYVITAIIAALPDQLASGDWVVAPNGETGTLEITISGGLEDNGTPITAIQRQVDGGSWVSLGGVTTGTYEITGLTNGTEYDIALRVVNGVGNGVATTVKSATPAEVPDNFAISQWSISDRTTGGSAIITINQLPEDNGAAITSIERQIDSGAWVTLTNSPAVGSFDLLNVFTNGVEATVRIRAVNSIGASPESGGKTVVPTLNSGSSLFTINSDDYTGGSAGSGPALDINVSTENTVGPYYFFWATHANDTTLSKTDITTGSGDAEDRGSLGPQNFIENLDGTATLSVPLTNGHLSYFYRDSSIPPKEGDVVKIDSVNVDATAPTFSSSTPADNATSVALDVSPTLTFSENLFGVIGKDFYLWRNIDTTPVLVETFVFTSATSATGTNGGSASITTDTVTINPGANLSAGIQYAINWEAGAVTDSWGNPVAVNSGYTVLNFTTAASVANLDNFNRSNEALEASSNWTQVAANSNISADVVSNVLRINSTSGFQIARYTYDITPANDQYLKWVWKPPSGSFFYVFDTFVRLSVDGFNQYSGYGLQYGSGSGGYLQLKRWDNDSEVDLGSSYSVALADGDEVALEAEGSTIRVKVNGSTVITQTSATYTSGKSGFRAVQDNGYIQIDDWETGDL